MRLLKGSLECNCLLFDFILKMIWTLFVSLSFIPSSSINLSLIRVKWVPSPSKSIDQSHFEIWQLMKRLIYCHFSLKRMSNQTFKISLEWKHCLGLSVESGFELILPLTIRFLDSWFVNLALKFGIHALALIYWFEIHKLYTKSAFYC